MDDVIVSREKAAFDQRVAYYNNLVMSLAYELCEAEGLTLANAIAIAADDLSELLAFNEEWDRQAFRAGNDDAMPF